MPRGIVRDTGVERGASAVEFALVSTILFTLIFGTVQYGLYFWSLQSGAHAARESARQAAVGVLDCTQFRNAVSNNSRGAKPGTISAKRTFYTDSTLSTKRAPGPVQIGDVVQVQVTFDSIDLKLPFVPFINNGRVSEYAVARVENVNTTTSTDCP